jgi:hypothetical protein
VVEAVVVVAEVVWAPVEAAETASVTVVVGAVEQRS